MDPNLESGIRSQILQRIPQGELSAEEVQYLSNLPLRGFLSVYYNWRNRSISARPREIHLSGEIIAKNPPDVERLAQKIRTGCDLSPHLSTRAVKIVDLNPKRGTPGKLGSRQDLDLLLSDWGIHHLHLSDVDRGDGYVVRGDNLLFAVFRRNDAYLLDVLGHEAWSNTSLVEIATKNWPGLFPHFRGMTTDVPVSETDIKNLRDKGITSVVPLSTGVALGGITRDGTSARVEAKINQFLNQVALDEERCSHADILAQIPKALDFHPFSDG